MGVEVEASAAISPVSLEVETTWGWDYRLGNLRLGSLSP